MSNEIALRPSYWASVSGGKDSLYMLNLILHNLDRANEFMNELATLVGARDDKEKLE